MYTQWYMMLSLQCEKKSKSLQKYIKKVGVGAHKMRQKNHLIFLADFAWPQRDLSTELL